MREREREKERESIGESHKDSAITRSYVEMVTTKSR